MHLSCYLQRLSGIKKLDDKLHHAPLKIWLIIANDENLGKCDFEFEFSEEGVKTCEKHFDEKSYECESLSSEKSHT